jgi:hypothetical protein
MRRSVLRASLAVAVAVGPTVAQAQEVSPVEHEAAVTNFQAGRRFVEQNNCRDAIPRFLESLKHEQNVGARFNLAECSRKEGRVADAWNQYKGAEQLAIQKKDDRAADTRGPLTELEPKVAKIRLVLPQAADMVVKIDGKVVESTDFNLLTTGYAITPNEPHTIEVTARNYRPWTKTDVKGIAAAELPAMTVDLGPPLVAEGSDAGAGDGQRVAGFVAGGVGLVGVVVGSVFGFMAIKKNSDFKNSINTNCTDPANKTGCNDTVRTARTDISGPATISTIGFIAGGVLVAAGAVLYFTAPRAPSTSAARLHVAPAIGVGSAGALLGGSF